MNCVLKLKYVINLSIQAITIAIIKHGFLFIHFSMREIYHRLQQLSKAKH